MVVSELCLPSLDGHSLGVTLREPARRALGVVLLHPATAVPERLYAPIADALAARGFAVVTYDYRGIGRSRPPRLRGFSATMLDWADLDVDSVTEWARQRWPDAPLLAVGHSFGGHAIGLCASSRHLTAAALVASHAGCLRFITPAVERWRATALLKLVCPLTSAMLGYVPSRRIGIGEDLPAGVARQWSRWTSLPRYFFDDPAVDAAQRFARVNTPLLILGFDDDPWATPPGIDLLASHFTSARIERHHLSAKAVGSGPIGHFGFFRRQHEATLWPTLLDWLEARAVAA
ncbi:alpha/beta fold hydrolase [Azospirillum griseum]|uniref:Alpha/beta fold hydrolase n=1 Tax=Azospirillum griseum TaxID=2496639 RepID=A0A431VFK2_9PROT|nr:alpha/beta fold hydrolase [Azospirillum griseum]RTR19131.1 alpha/beta fold hydrolase [Azospirillum griseum]